MRIQIVTCNSIYENGKYKESYHEIHEIDNLKSIDHIIATIQSVIINNNLFKDINDTLDSVIVSGSDYNIIESVINFFHKYLDDINIMGAETALYM